MSKRLDLTIAKGTDSGRLLSSSFLDYWMRLEYKTLSANPHARNGGKPRQKRGKRMRK
jgi:hypothetical protein